MTPQYSGGGGSSFSGQGNHSGFDGFGGNSTEGGFFGNGTFGEDSQVRGTAENLLDVCRLYTVAMLVVLVWDHIVTLAQERKKIWQRPWGLVKVFFLVNRYGMLVAMIILTAGVAGLNWSAEACEKYNHLMPGFAILPLLACDALLILRTWIVWAKSRRILIGLIVLEIAAVTIQLISTFRFQPLNLPRGIDGCLDTGETKGISWLVGYWFSMLVVNTTTFALTLTRVVQLGRRNDVVLNTIWRDGLIFYAIIMVCMIVNLSFFAFAPASLKPINTGLVFTATSLSCSRFVLNLRRDTDNDGGRSFGRASPAGTTDEKRACSPEQSFAASDRGLIAGARPEPTARESFEHFDHPAAASLSRSGSTRSRNDDASSIASGVMVDVERGEVVERVSIDTRQRPPGTQA